MNRFWITFLAFCVLFAAQIDLQAGTKASKQLVITDCHYTLDSALRGTKAPKEILDSITLLDVVYFGFDSKLHRGQILVNKEVAEDVKFLFELMRKERFPIKSTIPIVAFDWDDDKSMEANNTSSFNYRKVAGKNTPSNHSWGRAIDINPFTNPAVYKSGKISPKGAKYIKSAKGAINGKSKILLEMKKRGWEWGGVWTSLKDYQHIQKLR